jgi:hypothetical protein
MLNRIHDKQPFSLCQVVNIDVGKQARPRVVIIDMVVSSLLGGFIVILLSRPENVTQSFMGGLGLTGLLSPNAKSI